MPKLSDFDRNKLAAVFSEQHEGLASVTRGLGADTGAKGANGGGGNRRCTAAPSKLRTAKQQVAKEIRAALANSRGALVQVSARPVE
jgi:hypothetical protein